MKVTKEQLETNKIQLEITVSPEEFEQAMQKAYIKNVKNINVQGFRKGKAPRKLIEKTYGESVFYEEAADFILESTYPDAVEEEKIEPVDRPEIDIKQIGSDKEFIYTAKVTVKPEIVLGEYKGLEVARIEHAVTDEDINKEIDNMKEKAARFVDITDKAVENGDIAVIDFEGFTDGVAFDGGKAENHNLTIGAGQFIPGFEEQIIGKNIGEEFDVNVTFPAEYQSADLAGKEAVFKVKLNAIKKKEYPELDDEFAKDVSEFDTFEELKNATKDRLQKTAEARSKHEQEDAIIEKVLENITVEIPEVMVNNQIEEYIQDAKYRIQSQMPGITFEQYLEYTGGNLNDFRAGMKDKAFKDVKITLMLEAIAKAENIEVSDQDVEDEIKKIAEQYKMEEEKVRQILNVDQVKENILPRKVIEFLAEETKLS